MSFWKCWSTDSKSCSRVLQPFRNCNMTCTVAETSSCSQHSWCRHPFREGLPSRASSHWGYGATAARLTPDQKVGSSNLSALIFCWLGRGMLSECFLACPIGLKIPWHPFRRSGKRAHPDLNQGPADLQSAALTTELCTHMRGHDSISAFLHLHKLLQMLAWEVSGCDSSQR